MTVGIANEIGYNNQSLNGLAQQSFYRISFIDLNQTVVHSLKNGLQEAGLFLYFTEDIDALSDMLPEADTATHVVTEYGMADKLYAELHARFDRPAIIPYIVLVKHGDDATTQANKTLIKPIASKRNQHTVTAASKQFDLALATAIDVVSISLGVTQTAALELLAKRAKSDECDVFEVVTSVHLDVAEAY